MQTWPPARMVRLLFVLAAAWCVLPLTGLPATGAGPRAPAAPGPVRTWIVHFDDQLREIGETALQDLLACIPQRAEVQVVVPSRTDEAQFRKRIDVPAGIWDQLRFVHVPAPISAWARDRYLIYERHGRPTVLLPHARSVDAGWKGDLVAGSRLAELLPGHVLVRGRLSFEGGDLLLGRRVALVGVGTVHANCKQLGLGEEAVLDELRHLLGRRIVVVGEDERALPHAHLDMYAHLLDDKTVLVGDPRVALAAWHQLQSGSANREQLLRYGSPTRAEQHKASAAYEAVAQALTRQGFRVERVPALHAQDGDIVLAWTNAVTDAPRGERCVYLPTYGLPQLDSEAHAVWKRLGFRVHAVSAGSAITEGGAVRCLTNVVRGVAKGGTVAATSR